MTGMGRPPLWFYTTTHGPRTKESQVSQPRGRGAGQWPAAGGATHSTHSTQRKRARTTRTRHDKDAAETAKTRRRPRMRRKKVVRSAEYARETHVTLAGSRLARAAGMPRERGRRRSKRAGGAEWYEEKRRQERHPPRERKHISRAQCMTCSTVAVTTTEVTSHEATTCRRRCAPWLHAEPPTRKRSWHLAARSSPSSHPGDSHRRRPRQPARVPAPAPRGRSSPETARLRKN